MKLISWNVNGLRAVAGKGFADIFESFDADFVCLQETKLQAGQIDMEFLGYASYWNYADKKGNMQMLKPIMRPSSLHTHITRIIIKGLRQLPLRSNSSVSAPRRTLLRCFTWSWPRIAFPPE